MGLMRGILGWLFGSGDAGGAVKGVAEVFHPNATRRMELGQQAYAAAHDTHRAEFANARTGHFDALVNALNRLPRPMLALGTLGLFTHAMAAPDAFAQRMRGLAEVPEPLWWLLAAVVSFYFGARETHYLREAAMRMPRHGRRRSAVPDTAGASAGDANDEENAALAEWRARKRD